MVTSASPSNNEFIKPNCVELFNSPSSRFVIPLYQRSYDWRENEIAQLIHDIKTFDGNEYYLGNLIVNQKNNEYEVIDGQQRLTTLYLILLVLKNNYPEELNNYFEELKEKKEFNLKEKFPKFEARKKSKVTFEYLNTIPKGENASNIDGKYENSIICAYNIISDYLKVETDIDKLLNNLSKTYLFIIPVPENTDLNRYFETMNNRGIQLKQADIVKNHLLKCIKENDRTICSDVWNACSNMDEYFQKNLDAKINKVKKVENNFVSMRSYLLGEDWNSPIDDIFGETDNKSEDENKITNEDSKVVEKDIWELLEKYNKESCTVKDKSDQNYNEKEEIKQTTQHFESILSFEYFLLIVLQITFPNIKISFDDKKLAEQFKFKDNFNKNNVKLFFNNLVKARILFDNFIVKRTYTLHANKTKMGWGIVKCKKNDKGNYLEFTHSTNNLDLLEKIQSCLKVSYPAPSQVEWIYKSLYLLNNDFNIKKPLFYYDKNILNLIEYLEEYSRTRIKKYLGNSKENPFCKGTSTPRILFNYLDYLIYKKFSECNDDAELFGVTKKSLFINNYSFVSRDSVEHWHPQNPEQNGYKRDQCYLDNFGNLALVTIGQNSRFSNFMPEDKKKYLSEQNANYSLKLRIMQQLTNNKDKWMNENGEGLYKEHCLEMINLLMCEFSEVHLVQICSQYRPLSIKVDNGA